MACEEEKQRYIDEQVSYWDTSEALSLAESRKGSLETEVEQLRDEACECVRKFKKTSEMCECLDEKMGELAAAKKDLADAREEVTGLKNGVRSLRISLDEYFHEYFDCRKKCK